MRIYSNVHSPYCRNALMARVYIIFWRVVINAVAGSSMYYCGGEAWAFFI